MSEQVIVFDKAKYHLEGEMPEGRPERQAYLHPGMFFGWLVERHLVNDEMENEFADEIRRFRVGEISPAELFELVGGVLADDMLTEEGKRFAVDYYDQYLRDYGETLGRGLATSYHVEDTRENYEKMKALIETAFQRWKKSRK